VTDLCDYLGKKYGGWYPACEAYLRPTARSGSACRSAAAGAMMVYRESQVKAAGFDAFPKDTDGFLKLMQGAEGEGHARPAWRWATPPATRLVPAG
jgi:multiple sugar transport system substrate-binding protein